MAEQRAAIMRQVQQGPPFERPPCIHDSTRHDGSLDVFCLRCGAEGYWREGEEICTVEIHPSGKALVRTRRTRQREARADA